MRYKVTLLGLMLLLGGLPQEILAQDRLPIIDMHMHAKNSLRRPNRSCTPRPCVGAPRVSASDEDPMRLTVEAMERYNIVLGFLSDSPDDVFKWVEAFPGRFIASPTVPDPGSVDLARLRQEYEAGRFGGMGEISS